GRRNAAEEQSKCDVGARVLGIHERRVRVATRVLAREHCKPDLATESVRRRRNRVRVRSRLLGLPAGSARAALLAGFLLGRAAREAGMVVSTGIRDLVRL